jgi:hypothetical protein
MAYLFAAVQTTETFLKSLPLTTRA